MKWFEELQIRAQAELEEQHAALQLLAVCSADQLAAVTAEVERREELFRRRQVEGPRSIGVTPRLAALRSALNDVTRGYLV